MKYLMFETHKDESNVKFHIPIIFPVALVHRQVADAIKPILQESHGNVRVISAGDYCSTTGKCFGGSDSLKLHADPMDALTISQYDLFQGIKL